MIQPSNTERRMLTYIATHPGIKIYWRDMGFTDQDCLDQPLLFTFWGMVDKGWILPMKAGGWMVAEGCVEEDPE